MQSQAKRRTDTSENEKAASSLELLA